MNYRQTNIAGSKYRRFSRVVIENPMGAAPTVVCVAQDVLTLGGEEAPIVRDVGNLVFPFDPDAVYDRLDPLTGEPTGTTVTGAEVYAGVWSIVMAKAIARDEEEQAAA